MKKLTVVIPVYNEEANIPAAYAEVKRVLGALAGKYDHEIIFTDNHSQDRSFELLQGLSERDPRVKVVRFSRNFGYQKSIYTGYTLSTGDAVIQLDCDLQDPPEMIPRLVEKWEEGCSVVYGVRLGRKEGWAITTLRRLFYRIINRLSDDALPLDAGDFRLVDRKIVRELRSIYDFNPYLRGTIAAMGFKQVGVPYERRERTAGESKFPLSNLIRLAVDAFLNHSTLPLRLAYYTGLITCLAALGLMAGYILMKLFLARQWPAGFTTTTTLQLLSIGLNALFLGIIGEYLGRIYQQVKRHSITIIERSCNLAEGAPKDGV